MSRFLRIARDGLVLVLAVLVFVLECGGSLPATSLPLLALAVVVPEAAQAMIAIALVVTIAAASLTRGRVRVVAVACAGIGAMLALVPLAQFSAARAAADRELHRALDPIGDVRASTSRETFRFDVLANRPVRLRDGSSLALDVYRPRARGLRPTIVTIYGGAWIFGARADTKAIDEAYAARGYTVIAIDYRHAPTYRFPTQLDDVRDALATIAARSRAWHVDRDRVAIFGRSAGAELALLAAYERQPLRVRAVVGYYAPTDLTAGYDTPPRPDPADVRSILRAYIGAPPARKRAAYVAASPLAHVRAGLPPTLLVLGLRDALITTDMQRRLRDALRARNDRVAAIEIPWSNHAFDNVPGGLGAKISEPITRAFLEATLANIRPVRATAAVRRANPRRRSRRIVPPSRRASRASRFRCAA